MSPENRQPRPSASPGASTQKDYVVKLKSRNGEVVTVDNPLDRDFFEQADALILSLREDKRRFAGRD